MPTYACMLAGWDEQSIIGWDGLGQTWFAQLWRNGSTGDAPDVWLSGAPPIPSPAQLVRVMAATTGMAISEVHAAVSAAMGWERWW